MNRISLCSSPVALAIAHAHARGKLLEGRRLLSAADLDPAFHSSDELPYPPGLEESLYTKAVALAPDGSIFVHGHGRSSVPDGPAETDYVFKLRPNGDFDSNFGDGGIADVNAPEADWSDLAVRPGGGVVVGTLDGLLALDAAGRLDHTFGHDGTLAVSSFRFRVLSGDEVLSLGDNPARLKLMHPDGTADMGFGDQGSVDLAQAFGVASFDARDLDLTPDGHILVSGTAQPEGSASSQVVVGRLTAGGKVDTTFGTNGHGMALAPQLQLFVATAVGADGSFAVLDQVVRVLPEEGILLLYGLGFL